MHLPTMITPLRAIVMAVAAAIGAFGLVAPERALDAAAAAVDTFRAAEEPVAALFGQPESDVTFCIAGRCFGCSDLRACHAIR